MNEIIGKPENMKRINMLLTYKALIELKSATRAEISSRTQISTTTIRSLLEELLALGEIVELQLDESSGGRRAQRYALNPKKNLILSFYLQGQDIIYQVSHISGDLIESASDKIEGDNPSISVLHFVGKCISKWNICAVSLGVPGIVENDHYYVSTGFNQWYINNLGEQIRTAYNLPVTLENDLNAIALGYAINYVKSNSHLTLSNVNLTYIHFNDDCVGAGFIADGKLLYGAKRYAGEIGFLPIMPDKDLNDAIVNASGEDNFAEVIARLICIINCITNPSLVVIGGDLISSNKISLDAVEIKSQCYITNLMQPKIIFSNTFRDDYLNGLTYLTTESILPNLPL